jgi:hypothetical protein
MIWLYAKEGSVYVFRDLRALSFTHSPLDNILTAPVVSSSKISASSRDGLLKPWKKPLSGNLT